MADLANGLWSGHTTPSDAASYVGSVPGAAQCQQCQHLDTWSRVSQIMKVAVDMEFISIRAGWICATSVDRSGNRPAKAISGERQECDVPSCSLQSPSTSRRMPSAQMSEAMKLPCQDCQISWVWSRHHCSDSAGSICLYCKRPVFCNQASTIMCLGVPLTEGQGRGIREKGMLG